MGQNPQSVVLKVPESKSSPRDHFHFGMEAFGDVVAFADGQIVVEYSYLDGEPLVMWREDSGAVSPPEPEPEPEPAPSVRLVPTAPIGIIDTATPDFQWADYGTVAQYQLHVYDNTKRSSVLDQQFNAADICSDGLCSIKPTGLLMSEGANHSWNVRAKVCSIRGMSQSR